MYNFVTNRYTILTFLCVGTLFSALGIGYGAKVFFDTSKNVLATTLVIGDVFFVGVSIVFMWVFWAFFFLSSSDETKEDNEDC